jgi:hypothetical protein
MKGVFVGVVLALTAQVLVGQTTPHVPLGIVSDWTHHHVLYPDSKRSFRSGSDPNRSPLGAELVSPPLGGLVAETPSQAPRAQPQRLERTPGDHRF